MLHNVKIKYVGEGEYNLETGVTLNNVYSVLAIVDREGETRAVIQKDNGALYLTRDVLQTLIWELVSVHSIDAVRIYP